MKKLVAILGICLLSNQIYAQPSSGIQADSCISFHNIGRRIGRGAESMYVMVGHFMRPVIFEVNKSDIRATPQLAEAVNYIMDNKGSVIHIAVMGQASPEGPLKWNMKLGQSRAEALADYIVLKTGVDRDLIHIDNLGEDWERMECMLSGMEDFPNARRILDIIAEEQDSETRKLKIRALDGGKTWRRLIDEVFPPSRNARMAIISACRKQDPIAPEIVLPQLQAVPLIYHDLVPLGAASVSGHDAVRRSQWKIAVKNNLLFDAALVANLGVEISPWTHWSLDIPVWYSPYDITSTRKIRLLAVQPELRWWPREAMDGHFVGLHTHVAGFNIALDDYARYQDPNHALWGLGLSYGYALSLGKGGHWGMEFNIGAGFAKYRYDAYRNWSNGPKFKSGSDCYWGITRAGVTLSYKWDISRKSLKK